MGLLHLELGAFRRLISNGLSVSIAFLSGLYSCAELKSDKVGLP
jgi:hypothetical protein